MRWSRCSSARAISTASKRCGMCFGQLASHASTRKIEDLLAARLAVLRHQVGQQRGVVLDDARLAPELDALPIGVVDQEQMGLRILGEVALRDELPVAAKVREGDGLLVEHPQEARRAATVLDVGLAGGVRRAEENAGLGGDELGEFRRDRRVPALASFHPRVRRARALARLDGFDGRRKGDVAGNARVLRTWWVGRFRCW